MLKTLSKVNTGILLMVMSLCAHAQEPVKIANYMHNMLVINPAAAGMYETQFNASLMSRIQWNDFAGAPVNHLGWADFRFPKNKMALGLLINHDRYGTLRHTDICLNYAYKLDLSHKVKLSMGIKAGVGMLRYDASILKNVWDADDPLMPQENMRANLPKAGFGLQLDADNLYLGIAVPDLIVSDKNDVLGNRERHFMQKKRNYFMTGGYKIKLNSTYSLHPNFMVAHYTFSGWRADISLLGEINNYFWAGATYSSSSTCALMAGTHISSRLRFSYAYQFRAGSHIPVRLSTHEVNLLMNLHGLVKSKK